MHKRPTQDPTPLIAARLRDQRRRRGWSLDELGARAGVSKAMLSKLERGESSPTAMLLGRICGAYGITMSALVALPGEGGGRLVRRTDQPVWRDPQSHYVRRQVSPLSDLPLQLVEVELPAGAEAAFPAAAYAFIRQLVWVLGGRLEFVEGETVHRLGRGDCLELGAPADCVFRNRGRSTCRYVVALARR
ncbi:MAG TPA: XRE family transcriptional regulator [Burkholderiaceae bacterium]|nr:XRE family transcriptional regulator [Burkholderiaceae bacterium]